MSEQNYGEKEFALYLRPFESDGTYHLLNPGLSNFFTFASLRFYYEDNSKSLEHIVAETLEPRAVVVSIGGSYDYGGPGRLKGFDGKSWQGAFRKLVPKAHVIFCYPHFSKWFLWELEKIVELNAENKVRIIMPPLGLVRRNTTKWEKARVKFEQAEFNMPKACRSGGVYKLNGSREAKILVDGKNVKGWFSQTKLKNMILRSYA